MLAALARSAIRRFFPGQYRLNIYLSRPNSQTIEFMPLHSSAGRPAERGAGFASLRMVAQSSQSSEAGGAQVVSCAKRSSSSFTHATNARRFSSSPPKSQSGKITFSSLLADRPPNLPSLARGARKNPCADRRIQSDHWGSGQSRPQPVRRDIRFAPLPMCGSWTGSRGPRPFQHSPISSLSSLSIADIAASVAALRHRNEDMRVSFLAGKGSQERKRGLRQWDAVIFAGFPASGARNLHALRRDRPHCVLEIDLIPSTRRLPPWFAALCE